MSDSQGTASNNQQMIVIALVVIAALLAAIVGVIVWQGSRANKLPGATATNTATDQTANNSAATNNGSSTAPVAFDPKTATKVPSGTEPEAFVKAYHEAITKGDFNTAFKMLPLDKQQYYQDATSFASTLKSYGVSGYELEKAVVSGDSASVVAWMKTPNGSFGYKWVFEKVSGTWYVKTREQAGMK